jgi:hypothetical protein
MRYSIIFATLTALAAANSHLHDESRFENVVNHNRHDQDRYGHHNDQYGRHNGQHGHHNDQYRRHNDQYGRRNDRLDRSNRDNEYRYGNRQHFVIDMNESKDTQTCRLRGRSVEEDDEINKHCCHEVQGKLLTRSQAVSQGQLQMVLKS